MPDAFVATRRASWIGVCALGFVMLIAVPAGALAQNPSSAEARLKELSIALPPVLHESVLNRTFSTFTADGQFSRRAQSVFQPKPSFMFDGGHRF